jgi:tetratricopeptide (TPR) repeat protein
LEHIAPLLADPDRTVRVSSGLALGFLGDARGIHVCDAVLKADPDWMRCYAVYALWYMNTARARLVLDRNGSRQSAFVRGIIRSARNTPFKEPEKERQMLSADAPKLGDVWAGMYEHFIMESDDWFHRGDYDQAIRCQEAALFIDPAYAEAYSLISWLQWSMGDDAAAIKTLNRGVKAIPDCPDTWGALGQHYWMTKRYELALEPLRKAIELGGDHTIRRPYAYCLEKTGQLEKCLAQWEVLVKECPDDPAAPLNAERIRKKVAEQNLAQ